MSIYHRALAGAAALAAFAVIPASAAPVEKQFDDWKLVCDSDKAAKQPCYITQHLVAPDTGLGVAAAAVVFLPGKKEPSIAFNVAPQADPKQPIAVQIDDKAPLSHPIESCNADRCSMTASFGPALQKQFQSGKKALLSFAVQTDGARIAVPLSLKGFSAAFKALQAQKG